MNQIDKFIDLTLKSAKNTKGVQFENLQILFLLQASLGLITENVLSIALETTTSSIIVHINLNKKTSTDSELIEDIIFEFEALQVTNIPIKTNITYNEIISFNKKRFIYIKGVEP